MTGPLGALPKLSPSARRALLSTGLLATGNAIALIAQAWALATGLAAIVTGGADAAAIGDRLVVLAVATLGRAVFGWAIELVSARAAAGAKEELRRVLLDSSLRRGPEWIRERGPAELTSLATKGLDSLDAYFTKYLPALVTAAVVPPLVGAWILASDAVAALTIAITVPLIPLFAWLVGRYTETRTSRAADAAQRLSGQVLELVRALPVLTAFGRARAQGEVVRKVSERHRRSTISTLRIAFLSALVLEFLASLSVALIAVGIGFRLVSGELDLATGLLVLVLAPECYLPLRAAGAAHHASEDGVEAVRRVDEVVPTGSDRSGGSLPGDGPLRVRDLRVRRRDGYAPEGLGFTARPGEIVHLDGFDGIGPSGSGKSTTFAVLLGFTVPEAGGADYGGTDIEDIDRTEWRRLLAWVPQQPAFTGGTVADELALAVSDQPAAGGPATGGPATGGPAEALRQAGAAHLADRRVDELSTGERQRIALARAFLRVRTGARILLLDEPTAHLDAATARHVNTEIRRVAEQGTAVVLASHRPDTGRAEAEEPRAAGGETPPVLPAARPHWRDLITARGLLGVGLGALSLVSGLALTATAAWLIARASQQPPVLALSVAAVGVRTFALSRAGFRYIERLATHDAAFRLSTRLRGRLWNGLVRLGPVRSATLRRDDGVARLVDDVDTVRDLVPRVLLPPAVAVIVALAAVVVQSMVLPQAGALLAGSLLLAGIGGSAVGLAAERHASLAVSEGRRRVSARVLALLDGAAELIAFGAHTTRRAELAEEDARLAARTRRAAFGAGAATAVLIVAVGAAVFGGVWLGADAVAAGRLAPELAPLLALVPLAAAEAVNPLPEAARQWRSLRAARSRLAPLLATGAEDDGEVGAQQERTEPGAVRLHAVSARWPGADGSALRSANLVVPAGAHVAVVGPSGGGKSTLMTLLLGFLRPEHGHLSVPDRVAWCPQEPQLVATTLRENLRVAAPTADDRELAGALDRAGLPEWETRLDEFVGAGGAAVSGGEAQRIALARALLYRDAELMLLDEPTAHLDVPTSEALLSRMRHDLRDVTVFHVTHRWSETEHADIVVRIEGGEISVLREDATAGSRESPDRERNAVHGGGE
ncbi:thiol reductant ABC exporter subunit CydD [Parasphingorhabdus pacifica]